MLLLVACGPEQQSQTTLSEESGRNGGLLRSHLLASSGTWAPTASLGRARYYHTASLIPGGKVLVVGGGLINGSVLNQTELYDPATASWAPSAPLSQPRLGHSATLLPDRGLLVVGGWDGTNYVPSAEIYDSGAGTWTETGSLNQERHYHTATLLPDGRVLVVGGWNSGTTLASAELYDPSTGRWTVTGSLTQVRDSHTATLLSDGKVLVVGGWGTSSYLASAELYDPATGKWTAAAPLNFARGYHTATLLANGKILVVGGYDESGLPASAELYNPSTGLWERASSPGQARYYHTATLLQDGQVFISGGYGTDNTSIASAELYEPDTGLWTSATSMAEARSNHTATLLPNGQVLTAGGKSSLTLNSAELYGVSGGDDRPPETQLDSQPDPRTNSTSASFAFSSNEAGATFECSLDGASFSGCTSPALLQALSERSHTFRVRARDTAGNIDATPASYTWTVDLTSPDTKLDSVPPERSNAASASFAFSSNEAGATFECSLDGASFSGCTSPVLVRALSEGSHTFRVRARDAAGNVDATPASYTWTVDQTPLDTRLDSTPPTRSNSATATFTFSSTHAGATFECSLDAAAFTACDSPASLSGLSGGRHTFQVRSRDAAGNVDATPASHAWIIILPQSPVLGITSPTSDAALSGAQPTLSGTAPPDSTITIHVDGVVVGSTTADSSGHWQFAFSSPLAEGEHSLFVTASYGDETIPSSSTEPFRFTVNHPTNPSDGSTGCTAGGGSPLVWMALLLAAPATGRRRSPSHHKRG